MSGSIDSHAPGASRVDRPLLVPGRLVAAVMLSVVAFSALVLLSWVAAAIAHADDGYAVDHVAGTWMALASYANSGTLYPPLHHNGFFGGTRFMPVPILLQAAAARVSGEYLVSAKVLSYLLAAALISLTFVLIRRTRCPAPVALLLASSILVTGSGLTAALSVRNDTLPLLLQLVALAVASGSPTARRGAGAGALCALALLSKLSAVWAPLAIAIWLLRRERRVLAAFGGVFLGTLAVGILAFELASHGRMAENVVGLSFAAAGRTGSVHDVVSRLRLIAREGLGWLDALAVPALLGTILAAWRRQLTLYHVALCCAAVVTAVVLVDPGAFINHLLDVQVLALVVVGDLWRRVSPAAGGLSIVTAVLLALLLACSAVGFAQNVRVGRDVRALVHGTTSARDAVPRLGAAVRKGGLVLSEDPFVPVSRGERPVVLDPFMLLSVLEKHPIWRADLVRRIRRHEFAEVVLFYVPSSAPFWYSHVHFGAPVVNAVERSYRPVGQVDGYWIYRPRGSSG